MCKCPDGYECGECYKPEPKPHKHAALIKAWADGATIECRHRGGPWFVVKNPMWTGWEGAEYRIKPEPKPDLVSISHIHHVGDRVTSYSVRQSGAPENACRFIFDGETNELKSVELIK